VANDPRGVGWGLFIAPATKRAIGELFTGQVQCTSLEAGVKSLEAGLTPDKSGPTTRQVRWGFLEASRRPLEASPQTGLVRMTGQVRCHHRTSPMGGGALESDPEFLEAGGSPDKSDETRKFDFWIDKHLDLSPNFFGASLLIVQLSYDSNKI
jgi:hypothetical protein